MSSKLGIGPPAAKEPQDMRVGDEIVRVGPEGVTPLYRGRSNFAPQRPEPAPANAGVVASSNGRIEICTGSQCAAGPATSWVMAR